MRRRGFKRELRINEVIQAAVASMLQRGEVPLLPFVTVTGVKVSPDLSFARIYISVLDEITAKDVIDCLNDEAKHLRYLLSKEVRLRVTPELKFYHDDSSVRGNRISFLINGALKGKDD